MNILKKFVFIMVIIIQMPINAYCYEKEDIDTYTKLGDIYNNIYCEENLQRMQKNIKENIAKFYYGGAGLNHFGKHGTEYLNYFIKLRREIINQDGTLKNASTIDYAKAILYLVLFEENPENIDNHNLYEHLYNFDTIAQNGAEGVAWALLAFDCHNYKLPIGAQIVTREQLVQYLLDTVKCTKEYVRVHIREVSFSLQALYPYRDSTEVNQYISDMITILSDLYQNQPQEFLKERSETIAQLVIALSTHKIDADADSRFISKDTNESLFQLFLKFQKGEDKFSSYLYGEPTESATQDCAGAIVAYGRLLEILDGEEASLSIYDLNEVKFNEDMPLSKEDYYHLMETSDIAQHWSKPAYLFLMERGILKASASNQYNPDKPITRAEFIDMIIKTRNVKKVKTTLFQDVKEDDWYNEIIGGYIATFIEQDTELLKFYKTGYLRPNDSITREEAAFILACKTPCETDGYSEKLLPFDDYSNITPQYQESFGFCVATHVLTETNNHLYPKRFVTNAESVILTKRMYERSSIFLFDY